MSAKVFLPIVTLFLIASNLLAQQKKQKKVFKVIGEEYRKGEEPKASVDAEKILDAIRKGWNVHIENASIRLGIDEIMEEIERLFFDYKLSQVTKKRIPITVFQPTGEVRIIHSKFENTVGFLVRGKQYKDEEPKTIVKAEKILQAIQRDEDIYIENTLIVGELNISKIKLEEEYRKPVIKSGIFITNSKFSRNVDFRGATFSEDADFRGSTFSKDAEFRCATFSSARFRWSTFSYAGFAGATFNYAGFMSTTFNGDVDFSDAIFYGNICFTYTEFKKTLFLSWEQIEGKLDYDGVAYINLIKKFKEQEQFDDADNAYYSYRVEKRKHEKRWYNPYRWLEFVFLDLTCGYGVKPFRAIICGLAIILIFTAFYYRAGAIQERKRENEETKERDAWQRFWDALYFSVNTFTTVGYGDWYPTDEYVFKFKRWKLLRFRTLAMLEGLFGWIILALFLVTLGKVWIR